MLKNALLKKTVKLQFWSSKTWVYFL